MRLSQKQKLERDVAWLKQENAALVLEKLRQADVITRLTAAADPDLDRVAREVIRLLCAALRSRLHNGKGAQRDCGCDGCTAVKMADELGYTERERSDGAQARNGGQGGAAGDEG